MARKLSLYIYIYRLGFSSHANREFMHIGSLRVGITWELGVGPPDPYFVMNWGSVLTLPAGPSFQFIFMHPGADNASPITKQYACQGRL
jgi:hypothetical protein